MGIKGFRKAMKDLAPETFGRMLASDLAGRRVAIDTPGIAWRILASGHRIAVEQSDVLIEGVRYEIRQKFFLDHILRLVKKFLRVGIVPVFVLEGKAPPEKVIYAHARRGKSRDSLRQRLADMEDRVRQLHISDHTPELAMEYKKLLRQDVRPRQEEFVALQDILQASGIPCIRASGEAERLCVSLALEGHVEAVYTKDTDIFPMGCQLMLTDIEETPRGLEFLTMSLSPILTALGLNFEEFVDLCIMSECDFNKNIPGYALKKSYKLLLTHRRIENLPAKFDISVLNHTRCRELFQVADSETEAEDNLIVDIQPDHLTTARSMLTMYEVDFILEEFMMLYSIMPKVRSRGHCIPPTSGIVKFVIE